jgi:hypothetical protein
MTTYELDEDWWGLARHVAVLARTIFPKLEVDPLVAVGATLPSPIGPVEATLSPSRRAGSLQDAKTSPRIK